MPRLSPLLQLLPLMLLFLLLLLLFCYRTPSELAPLPHPAVDSLSWPSPVLLKEEGQSHLQVGGQATGEVPLSQHPNFPLPSWSSAGGTCQVNGKLWVRLLSWIIARPPSDLPLQECVGEDRTWGLVFVDHRPGESREGPWTGCSDEPRSGGGLALVAGMREVILGVGWELPNHSTTHFGL